MIRIAISGAGAIAERAHIPALLSTGDFEVVAVQSRTAEKANRMIERLWPAPSKRPAAYTDFDLMLAREKPDAVGIFTPNYLHCGFALSAFAAGAHVLCEKPMAPTFADARRMVDEAARTDRILMVTMQSRYAGFQAAIKRALDEGVIGQPNFIRARLSHGGPEGWAPGQKWFVDPAQAGGGAMLDLGVHVADLARWYLGDVESVQGRVATLRKEIEVEDTGVMLLQFRSGALGVIEASWASQPPLSAIEIYCTEGRIMTGYPRTDISILRADGNPPPGYSREEILSQFDASDLLAPFRAVAQNFAAAIGEHAAPNPDGHDGLRAIELIEACYRSSREGRRIELPLG
jgi:UDP-N-acetylglucosamine 3-dehydrogenase